MSNDNATSDNEQNPRRTRAGSHNARQHLDAGTTDPLGLPTVNGARSINGNGTGRTDNGKSDSEAETVVLSGKEEGRSGARRKTIKHEDLSDDQRSVRSLVQRRESYSDDNVNESEPDGARRRSLKRKRITHEINTHRGAEGGNSSNLSSADSSPGPQPPSDKNQEYDSDRSRSSPPVDEDIRKKKARLRKRKLESVDDQDGRKRRGKSDPSLESAIGKERREPRRVRKQNTSSVRSESPPSHQHLRTQSTQTSSIPNGVKRKKAPPSLSIDSRKKPFEDSDGESDDSRSQKGRPRLHKSASVDEPMTSKLSHKKILDRSGRTPVARACAANNIEQLALELKERPWHLNESDYAKNQPLQIAALEGYVETVQYLIKEGCIVNCKNVDGDTPLIDAVENGHLQVVNLLLEAGADPRLRNGKGFEPLELVNAEHEDYESIRDSLTVAKEKFSQRRPSEDQSTGAKENDGTSVSAPGGSPTDSLQTQGGKPGSAETSAKAYTYKWENDFTRKKTTRREPTREDLLWITSTPAKLKDAASKGDIAVVGQCLITLKADTESMLAAARGGHDDVLEILIALGSPPNPDPDPLASSEYRAGHNTPMLAAIGGGNVKVIKLLLGQRRFDPTRRIYRGLTYYELAKQRQSSNWQDEYEVLKEAYDNYSTDGSRRSESSSPHKVRTKRPDPSSSPAAGERSTERIKREHSHKSGSHKHLHPNDTERKGSASAISDREVETAGPRKQKVRSNRSVSDAGSTAGSKPELGTKPRRRLLSKNEIQSDHDIKRRTSLTVEKSPTSRHEKTGRIASDSPVSVSHDKKRISQAHASTHSEGSKKRSRTSTSPHEQVSDSNRSQDTVKKKKRQRADSGGNISEQDRTNSLPRGPAMVATMIASPEPVLSPIKTPGTAPVAFMGGSTASPPMVRSPIEHRSSLSFPVSSLDSALQHNVPSVEDSTVRHHAPAMQPPNQSHEPPFSTLTQSKPQDSPSTAMIQETTETQAVNIERENKEKVARDMEALKARGREARAAREQEEAQLKAQREEAELQRQMQTEREEAEARAAKKRLEEQQMQMRRAEQERIQREKEERRRQELELREEQRRVRIQEEQEMQRRAQLTLGLRRAAELRPEEARRPQWIQYWLPLYYITSEDLDPDCDTEDANERWISNVQVAPLLANRDLELSQYTAWTRRSLTTDERGSLWRNIRNQQSGIRMPELAKAKDPNSLLAEGRRSFFTTLNPIFWLRYSDFESILPRHPHLAQISGLPMRHMQIMDYPFGAGGTWDDEKPEGRFSYGQKRKREEEEDKLPANGSTIMANGDLPNGHV